MTLSSGILVGRLPSILAQTFPNTCIYNMVYNTNIAITVAVTIQPDKIILVKQIIMFALANGMVKVP